MLGARPERTLYSVSASHAGYAARLMLARKRLNYRLVTLPPGLHPPALRALGFPAGTVPALIEGDRRIQGTLQLSRALDEIEPARPLFPDDPAERARVEAAELWGEEVLQPFPRRIVRWLNSQRSDARAHMSREAGLPAARLLGAVSRPIASYFARDAHASDEAEVRAMVATLPTILEQADRLIRDGTIGADSPNAADFQIAATIRLLLDFFDLAPIIERYEVADYARAIAPDAPFFVPAGWIPATWLNDVEG